MGDYLSYLDSLYGRVDRRGFFIGALSGPSSQLTDGFDDKHPCLITLRICAFHNEDISWRAAAAAEGVPGEKDEWHRK